MKRLFRSRRVAVAIAGTAVLAVGGLGIAVAASSSAPPSNSVGMGRGIPEYGNTHGFYKGLRVNFQYTRGYYCDTRVYSTASSKCEAGANYKKAPAKQFDPLYITVPLGFSQPMQMIQCPNKLACVDHPGTIDLRRLEPALKPLYPTLTDAQLRAALRNYAVPEHDHFITDLNGHQPEWWDVKIIGVTDRKTFNAIRMHESYSYIAYLLKHKNKHVVGPIPTNLFLYFSS